MATTRTYLITGAARGIGRGLTRLLLQRGHTVFALDNNEAELQHLTSLLADRHNTQQQHRYFATRCDLRDPAAIRRAVDTVRTYSGNNAIDVLINNAANTAAVGATALEDMTLDEWNKSIQVNLTAPMLLSQACLPLLSPGPRRSRGGCIIHMSSTRAMQSEPHNEPYSATKAGLLGLSQSMAVSLAERGIRVNAILPGWINVEDECKSADEQGRSWEHGLSDADHRWQLTGRVGKVEDVLAAVEYLVTNEGVTGAEIVVDGGVTRKMVYPDDE